MSYGHICLHVDLKRLPCCPKQLALTPSSETNGSKVTFYKPVRLPSIGQ